MLIDKMTYLITHKRKGRFVIYIDHQDDTWIYGTVTEGYSKAMLIKNEKCPGDEISLRKALICYSIEINPVEYK